MPDHDSTLVCACPERHESVADCPKAVPVWMRECDEQAASALREANRLAAPMFGMMFGDDTET